MTEIAYAVLGLALGLLGVYLHLAAWYPVIVAVGRVRAFLRRGKITAALYDYARKYPESVDTRDIASRFLDQKGPNGLAIPICRMTPQQKAKHDQIWLELELIVRANAAYFEPFGFDGTFNDKGALSHGTAICEGLYVLSQAGRSALGGARHGR